jgi:hypothetical protein
MGIGSTRTSFLCCICGVIVSIVSHVWRKECPASPHLIVINLGVDSFAKNFEDQKVEVVRVDCCPPAGGDKEMINLLDQLM